MRDGHPTDPEIRGYRLGQLAPGETATLREHLEACSICRSRLNSMTVDGLPVATAQAARTRGTTLPGPARSETLPERGVAAVRDMPHVPDYEMIRLLGEGGMGAVFQARHLITNRVEALKILKQSLVDQPRAMERFLREVQAAVQLEHRNIVRAYTAIRCEGGLVLAMEFIDGENLEDLVARRGPLPVHEACFFAFQAAQGLQHIHSKGMVHRDIKPQNLMLDVKGGKGLVKILDAGLAKATSEALLDGGLTRHGAMIGTPDYISPEQIRDAKSADIRADIYSLGCTLYFLLNGQPPFAGKESLYDIFQAHHSQDPVALDELRPDIPFELAALVDKMMAKAPGDRFPTPAEVAPALRPFLQPGSAPTASPPGARAPSPRAATLVEASSKADAEAPTAALSEALLTLTEAIPLAEPEGPRLPTRRRSETLREGPTAAVPERLRTIAENPIRIAPTKPKPPKVEEPTPLWKHPQALAAAAVLLALAVVGGSVAMSLSSRREEPRKNRPGKAVAVAVAPRYVPKGFENRTFRSQAQGSTPPPLAPASPVDRPAGPPPRPTELNPAPANPAKSGEAGGKATDEEPEEEPDTPDESKPEPDPGPAPAPTKLRDAVVGADGFYRVSLASVAADPDSYMGKRVVPDKCWRIVPDVFSESPNRAPGYATLIVRDHTGRMLCDEWGPRPTGRRWGSWSTRCWPAGWERP